MAPDLDLEAIRAEAQRRALGLHDLGSGPFAEPLARLLTSLEKEARLNALGRQIARERVLGHVVNRLGYVDDRKRFPDIASGEPSATTSNASASRPKPPELEAR